MASRCTYTLHKDSTLTVCENIRRQWSEEIPKLKSYAILNYMYVWTFLNASLIALVIICTNLCLCCANSSDLWCGDFLFTDWLIEGREDRLKYHPFLLQMHISPFPALPHNPSRVATKWVSGYFAKYEIKHFFRGISAEFRWYWRRGRGVD